MKANSILDTIGNTPHIRLNRLFGDRAEVWVKAERANPDLLNAKRRIRIASGSGTKVEDVNKLMKQHRQMADMMKKLGAMGKGGMLKQTVQKMFGKGGPTEEDMAAAKEAMAQGKMPQLPAGMQLPKGLGGLGGMGGGLPQGLSGLMRKK